MHITSFKNKNVWCVQTILDHLYINCDLLSSVSFVHVNMLEDFETHHPIFARFLQTVYAIEKSLASFNVQSRIGMNQSVI